MKTKILSLFALLIFMVACQPKGVENKPSMSESTSAGNVLPQAPTPFKGKIAKTFEGSEEDFPQPVTAPKGAPNVLLILLDDVGFGQPSTFGGPIPTPNIDKLATTGLEYTRFHTVG
ncbi:MAG: sulfatase-like hydrolase/transferase, partial [Mangrovibacterium sp.]